MNIGDVKNIVGLFAPEMPPEIFATHYDRAQLKLYSLRVVQKDYEALRYFRKTLPVPLYVSNGVATLPQDFDGWPVGYTTYGGQQYMVNFVDDEAFTKMLVHPIEYPDMKHPVAKINASYCYVSPRDIKHVKFSYLTRPEPITYAVKDTNGYLEFDETGSSSLQWNESDVPELVQYVLEGIGIIINQDQIKEKLNQQNEK